MAKSQSAEYSVYTQSYVYSSIMSDILIHGNLHTNASVGINITTAALKENYSHMKIFIFSPVFSEWAAIRRNELNQSE